MSEPVAYRLRKSEPPRWFRKSLASGLQRMVALALPGAPPAETVTLTAAAWCDYLWGRGIGWEETPDVPRIEAAFTMLGRRIERWPAPAHLLQHMPARPQPKALPELDRTPEQLARIQAHIRRTKELLHVCTKTDEHRS